jgi:hypothetical protein
MLLCVRWYLQYKLSEYQSDFVDALPQPLCGFKS